jgi:hypothetical protein
MHQDCSSPRLGVLTRKTEFMHEQLSHDTLDTAKSHQRGTELSHEETKRPRDTRVRDSVSPTRLFSSINAAWEHWKPNILWLLIKSYAWRCSSVDSLSLKEAPQTPG